MIDRILKPAKDANNVRRSMKRPRESTIDPPAKEIKLDNGKAEHKDEMRDIENRLEEKVEITSEPPTPVEEKSKVDLSEYQDDMDFSILEDDENQFSSDVIASTSNAVAAEKAEKMKAELLRKESENYASLLSDWENICSNENDADDELLRSIVDNSSTLASTVDGKKEMKFWFWDAYEDPFKFPGKVFLFGKMPVEDNPKEFKSVCVTIENVEKCLYLLPRRFVCISFVYIKLPIH